MQKIEAVIFDLGGVLLNIDYNLTRKAFQQLGIADFENLYSQANADELFSRLEKGLIKEEDFYYELRDGTGLPLTDIEIRHAWNAMLLDFRETSLDFLEKLKNNYSLFLLSNTNEIHLKKFYEIYHEGERAEPVESFFKKAFYSFEMGMRKPDPDIYEYVLEKHQLSRERTLFIDDSIQNIDTARQLGLQTVHLQKGMLVEELDWTYFFISSNSI